MSWPVRPPLSVQEASKVPLMVAAASCSPSTGVVIEPPPSSDGPTTTARLRDELTPSLRRNLTPPKAGRRMPGVLGQPMQRRRQRDRLLVDAASGTPPGEVPGNVHLDPACAPPAVAGMSETMSRYSAISASSTGWA